MHFYASCVLMCFHVVHIHVLILSSCILYMLASWLIIALSFYALGHIHFTVHTCTSLMVCVVSLVCRAIRFPKIVWKHPCMHVGVFSLARRSPSKKAFGFSFGFTIFGETTVCDQRPNRQLKPPFET